MHAAIIKKNRYPGRYGSCIKTDKGSSIVSDWAIENMGRPRYPFDPFRRVISVSVETM